MSTIPLIASASDLEGAIRHATRNPASRWYVAKRAEAMGLSDVIPDDWAVVSSGLPDFLKDKIADKDGDGDGGKDSDGDGDGEVATGDDKECSHKGCDKKAVMFGKCKAHAKSDAPGAKKATTAAGLPRRQGDGTMGGMDSITAAGDFDSIHPRDRKGRFIEKMDLINVFSIDNPSVPSERGVAVGTRRNATTGIDEVEVSIPKGRSYDVQYVPVDRIESAPNAKARLDAPKRSTDNSIPTQIAPTMRSPKALAKDREALAEKRRKADGMKAGPDKDKANADADAYERRIDASDPAKQSTPAAEPDSGGGLTFEATDNGDGTYTIRDSSGEEVATANDRRERDEILAEVRGTDGPPPADRAGSEQDADENGNPISTVSFDGSEDDLKQYNDEYQAALVEEGGGDLGIPTDQIGGDYEDQIDPREAAASAVAMYGPGGAQPGGSPVSGMNDEDITSNLNDPDVRADSGHYSALVDHAVDAGWTLDGADDKWYAPGTHPDDLDDGSLDDASTSLDAADLASEFDGSGATEQIAREVIRDNPGIRRDDALDMIDERLSQDDEGGDDFSFVNDMSTNDLERELKAVRADDFDGSPDYAAAVEDAAANAGVGDDDASTSLGATDERADGQNFGGWSAKLYDALEAKGIDPSDVDDADARDNFERGESPENYALEFETPPAPAAGGVTVKTLSSGDDQVERDGTPIGGIRKRDNEWLATDDRGTALSYHASRDDAIAAVTKAADNRRDLTPAEELEHRQLRNTGNRTAAQEQRLRQLENREADRPDALPSVADRTEREARRTPSPRGEVPAEMSDSDLDLAIQGERTNASTDDPAYNADRLTALVDEQNRRTAPGPKVGDTIRRPSDGAVGRITADDAGMASGSGKLQVEWDTPGAGQSASNKSWVEPNEIEAADAPATPAPGQAVPDTLTDRIRRRYSNMSKVERDAERAEQRSVANSDTADSEAKTRANERLDIMAQYFDDFDNAPGTQRQKAEAVANAREAARQSGADLPSLSDDELLAESDRVRAGSDPAAMRAVSAELARRSAQADGPSGAGPAVSAEEANTIAGQITMMARSANKDSVDVTEAQANERLATVLARANNGELEAAHKDMARLMTELKLGGKQRKRYREMLDRAFGGDTDGVNSGAIVAESTAADLRSDNPVKERLAAKAAEAKAKPEEIPDQPGYYKGKFNPGDSHWNRNPDDMSLADVEKDIKSIEAEIARMQGMSDRAGGSRANNEQTMRGLTQRLEELRAAAGSPSGINYDDLPDKQIDQTIEAMRALINSASDGPGDRARLADLRRVKAAREATRDAVPIAGMDDQTLWEAKSDLNGRLRADSAPELLARRDAMELEIRRRDIANASPTGRPMPTSHGDVDAGDVIRTDTGYYVVSGVTDDIKHGEPGWDGYPSLPDGSPDPDVNRFNKWGYADQINGITVKYADRPSSGKA